MRGIVQKFPETVLILESPLSYRLDATGGPVDRKPLEDDPHRPWHYQPAIGLALTAILFLRELIKRAGSTPSKLIVFEGFVSGTFNGRTHVRDAKNLLTHFERGHVLTPPGQETHSFLRLVSGEIRDTPAAVLKIVEKDYEKN